MSTTMITTASRIKPGDKIVRTMYHDGAPKRTATVRDIKSEQRPGCGTCYMFTTEPDGDLLGWYIATTQFTIERESK